MSKHDDPATRAAERIIEITDAGMWADDKDESIELARAIISEEYDRRECVWREDADGLWYTTCGALHVFTDGSPSQNSHQFCPYCGGRLVEKTYVEEEVGDE